MARRKQGGVKKEKKGARKKRGKIYSLIDIGLTTLELSSLTICQQISRNDRKDKVSDFVGADTVASSNSVT